MMLSIARKPVLFVLQLAILEAFRSQPVVASDCICTLELDIVCGTDGKTYSNPCAARCHDAEVAKPGPCAAARPAQQRGGVPCACNRSYLPVCGTDGKNYDNPDCAKKCGGADVAYEGRCASERRSAPCACNRSYFPVCGTDGKTYDNPDCAKKCGGVDVDHDGSCEAVREVRNRGGSDPCPCPAIYRPVCGVDGKTYSNKCAAECSGVAVAREGSCAAVREVSEREHSDDSAPCSCPANFDPVCGEDGKTYSNGCNARCRNVKVLSEGPCEVSKRGGTSPVCACNYSYQPVCGNDGATHSNPDCATRCSGVTDYVYGACSDACACNKKYDPVCSVTTGTKYVNTCYANCLGKTADELGPCSDK